MDDAELVYRMLTGERNAYAALVNRHAARVYALCRSRVCRREDARDIAREALLRGLRDLASLQEPERFSPWLLGIARNLCRAWHEGAANRRGAPGDSGADRPLLLGVSSR